MRSSTMKTTGLYIIILGLLLTIFTTFSFFTREKLADLGEVEISRDKANTLNWSPFLGIAVLGTGAIVFLLGAKKKSL